MSPNDSDSPDPPPAAQRAGRGWFRVRLITFLLAAAVIPPAISFSLRLNVAAKQKAAVRAIQLAGGAVWYDHDRAPDGPDISKYRPEKDRAPTTPPGPEWVRRRLGDDYFTRVVRVDFVKGGVTDADLDDLKEHLQALPYLEAVHLDESNVTDAGMQHLAGLEHLESLSVYGFALGDEGAKHLSGLRNLRRLDLRWTELTDDGLSHLNKMSKLETIYIWSSLVTDSGVEQLATLPELRSLSLQSAPVTDEGLKHLKRFPSLTVFSLSQSKVSPGGIESLKETLPDLKVSIR